MMEAQEVWSRGAERLAAAGIESARLDARVLLAHVVDLKTGELLSASAPSPDQEARYAQLLERRAAREPTAYIIGEREFWSLPFEVGQGVLIPRPETETLVEEAERRFPDRDSPLDVLDLGTGSGCLLLAFLSDYPNARGTGIDISASALEWARRNGDRHGLSKRSTWLQGGWSVAQGSHDVIFSNPPYLAEDEAKGLAPEIALYEPPGALFAGKDGLDAYRALGPVIAGGLKPTGQAFLEIGAGQQEGVCDVLVTHGLEILGITPDLSGIPRCVSVARVSGFSGPWAEKTVGNQRASR